MQIPILLSVVSLAILILGFFLWRATGQRKALVHTLFASFAMLYAAYESVARNRPEWSFVLPFFVTMLFGGRALGAWWRSRKEIEYQEPARIMTAVACLTLAATVTSYISW